MKTKSLIFSIVGVIVVFVLAVVFLRGGLDSLLEKSPTFPYSSPKSESSGSPSSPIQSKLTLSEKPLLNTPVILVFEFTTVASGLSIEAKIELSDSFELVNGALIWNGNLEANEEHKIEVVIKSTKVGYYQLSGSAISREGNNYFGDTAIIDIEVTPDNAIAGNKPENNWQDTLTQAVPLVGNNEQIQSELIFTPTLELNKEFTVIYRLTSSINLPDPQRTQINLVFPPQGFTVIDTQFPQDGEIHKSKGQLSWKGSINKDQTVEIKAILKVVDVGWGLVYGSLSVQPGGAITSFIQDVKIVDLYVDKYRATIQEVEPSQVEDREIIDNTNGSVIPT